MTHTIVPRSFAGGIRRTPRVHALPRPLYAAIVHPVYASQIAAHMRNVQAIARARMVAHAETRALYVGSLAAALLTLSSMLAG